MASRTFSIIDLSSNFSTIDILLYIHFIRPLVSPSYIHSTTSWKHSGSRLTLSEKVVGVQWLGGISSATAFDWTGRWSSGPIHSFVSFYDIYAL